MISKRYAHANNKYLPDYDTSVPDSYIMYLDANNMYGWAMSQFLPCGGLAWFSSDQMTIGEILETADDSEIGYFVEVDLHYPPHLHDGHNCYPLAPERVCVERKDLSPCAKAALTDNHFTECHKLIHNLNDKTN